MAYCFPPQHSRPMPTVLILAVQIQVVTVLKKQALMIVPRVLVTQPAVCSLALPVDEIAPVPVAADLALPARHPLLPV